VVFGQLLSIGIHTYISLKLPTYVFCSYHFFFLFHGMRWLLLNFRKKVREMVPKSWLLGFYSIRVIHD
jgi:hypothetical protein